jgi:hypothetical protein
MTIMNTEKTRTIKPGIIVALSTRIQGGVRYSRVDLERPKELDNGEEFSRWETTRIVSDPDDLARATKVRSTISGIIRRVCTDTAFGLICSEANEPALDEAIKRARVLASEHNATSAYSSVAVYVLKGRIASTDEEAARAIGEEVKSLIDALSAGIDALDPKAIRDAADRARKLGSVLDSGQEAVVSEAIKQARKAARTIVRRVEKDGEQAVDVLKSIQRGAIEKARLAFLDLDPVQAVPTEALPAVDVGRIAELDLPAEDTGEETPDEYHAREVAADLTEEECADSGEVIAASEPVIN